MNRFFATIYGVYIVWLRHLVVYIKTPVLNLFAPVYEPLLFLFAFGYGLGSIIQDVQYYGVPVSYLHFFVPGMIALACFYQSLHEAAYHSYESLNYSKLWHARLTSALTFDEIILGDLLWSVTKGMYAANIVGVVAVFSGISTFEMLFYYQPIICLGGLLFGSLGLIIAGASRAYTQVVHGVYFFMTPMMLFCGVFFPRMSMDESLDVFISALPVSLVVDLLRLNLGADYEIIKLIWLVVLSIICFIIAHKIVYRRLYN